MFSVVFYASGFMSGGLLFSVVVFLDGHASSMTIGKMISEVKIPRYVNTVIEEQKVDGGWVLPGGLFKAGAAVWSGN